MLFDQNYQLLAVLDFDDYRYSYLIEEAVMALMHNIHSEDQNIIRSGNFNSFYQNITNQELKLEFDFGLQLLLKARLLYDLSKLLTSNKQELAKELLNDPQITTHILS